jgi:2-keto-4-pentenoate hydratase
MMSGPRSGHQTARVDLTGRLGENAPESQRDIGPNFPGFAKPARDTSPHYEDLPAPFTDTLHMTPQQLLHHHDNGQLWSAPVSDEPGFETSQAYQAALAVRSLRQQRGEQARGYKIGFTNRTIWPLYQVYAPIWGTVWDSSLVHCDGDGLLSLHATCQPRLEPEVVFGMASTPAPAADLQALFEAIAWIAPGFEVVQSHLPDWKFQASDTVADSGLHARLLVGRQVPLRSIARTAQELDALLASMTMRLLREGTVQAEGQGRNVLDSPLRALHHFLHELRACPGATDLQAGDVITTGTWTDAFPIASGQHWQADFPAPLSRLSLTLT